MPQIEQVNHPNPLECILKWYDRLTPDMRATISASVVLHLPDIEVPDGTYSKDGGESLLREWLAPNQKWARTIIGKTVIFRALVNFRGANFFSKDRQQSMVQWREGFRQKLLADGDVEFAEKIGQSNEQSPLRDAHWSKAGDAWAELCENELSDISLEIFEHENRPTFF